jgi:hypothetical protein
MTSIDNVSDHPLSRAGITEKSEVNGTPHRRPSITVCPGEQRQREAVGGAGCVRDALSDRGEIFIVGTKNEAALNLVGGRDGQDDLLCARYNVPVGSIILDLPILDNRLFLEDVRRLQDDVPAMFRP